MSHGLRATLLALCTVGMLAVPCLGQSLDPERTAAERALYVRSVARVFESLTEGGLFATGSNEEASSPVHGAVYERTADGFRQRLAFGDGSPVDRIVRAHGSG